mmetsp:Transcript_3198/g.6164  ORF Transcript_3198/g.6164 Transcript_3198/m.6164 type:complete len:202 (+) Transcript_3198:1041-1646(+)
MPFTAAAATQMSTNVLRRAAQLTWRWLADVTASSDSHAAIACAKRRIRASASASFNVSIAATSPKRSEGSEGDLSPPFALPSPWSGDAPWRAAKRTIVLRTTGVTSAKGRGGISGQYVTSPSAAAASVSGVRPWICPASKARHSWAWADSSAKGDFTMMGTAFRKDTPSFRMLSCSFFSLDARPSLSTAAIDPQADQANTL